MPVLRYYRMAEVAEGDHVVLFVHTALGARQNVMGVENTVRCAAYIAADLALPNKSLDFTCLARLRHRKL